MVSDQGKSSLASGSASSQRGQWHREPEKRWAGAQRSALNRICQAASPCGTTTTEHRPTMDGFFRRGSLVWDNRLIPANKAIIVLMVVAAPRRITQEPLIVAKQGFHNGAVPLPFVVHLPSQPARHHRFEHDRQRTSSRLLRPSSSSNPNPQDRSAERSSCASGYSSTPLAEDDLTQSH